jgi:hypothetical protein
MSDVVIARPQPRAADRPSFTLHSSRSTLHSSHFRRELAGLGVLGLALAALFGRCVVPGVIGHQRDTGAFYYPLTHWFALELQSGRFPIRCPLIFGGYPLLADGEIGMLYPLNVLALVILPTDLAFMLVRTSNYFIAGLGAYALARVLGVGRVAGAYAGLSFALGSFMVGHLDHGNILRSAAWLPALLCCGELALRRTGRRTLLWIAAGAACLSLAGLGLHPQILLIELVILWSYLPLRALALPHDRISLSAEQVRGGALAALNWTNSWTVLGLVVLTATVALLWKWQQMPGEGRRWQVVMLTLATTELLMVAHAFHPTAPVETLTEASKSMQFLSTRDGLSTQDGLWRTFISGRTDLSITSRPALFGIAQPYGYSSLPTTRMERYWTRVDEVDDELLDLWNSRYVVESKIAAGRMWAHDVLFDPNRPLLDGTPDSPLGQEAFGVSPTPTDTIRLISAVNSMADLPDGTVVAELVVSGGDAPPESRAVRLGTHTAEAAYDDLGSPRPSHARPTVAYQWAPHDPVGRIYRRNLYVGDVTLASPRRVDRVEVRTLAPHGRLRVVGLALRDRATGGNGSLLPTHRLKYSLVYEDEATAIYENRAALPRAFVVDEAKIVRPDEWGLLHLLDPGFDPRRRVILERPAPAPEGLAAASPSDGPKTATVERYESDRVVVHATSSGGGHLVMTDTLFPGWRAWVDGREVPIDRANYLFRSIALPPGEHRVELRFQPRSFYIGATASVLAIAAMMVLAVVGARRTPAVSRIRRTAGGTIPEASEQFPPALRGAGAFGGVSCIPSESSPETFSKRPS